MGRYMGQEIHRQGIIVSSEIHGADVMVGLTGDQFSLTMLRMHLEVDYPEANIIAEEITWAGGIAKVTIRFACQEDAMHFHLRH